MRFYLLAMGMFMCLLGGGLMIFALLDAIDYQYAHACFDLMLSWQCYLVGVSLLCHRDRTK